jgi:hypothetical protein
LCFFLWYRDLSPPRSGMHCGCGYNLTGNVSGRCPECGASIPEETRAALKKESEVPGQ